MIKRKRLLIATLLVIVVVLGLAGMITYDTVARALPTSYAAWSTGDILVHYMKTHDDNWPTSWADIAEATDSLLAQRQDEIKWGIYVGRGLMTTNRDLVMSELKRWIEIDWSAQPQQMLTQPSPPAVVNRPGGKRFRMIWEDPNQMVYDYLKTTTGDQE